jgi:hypothetical protein
LCEEGDDCLFFLAFAFRDVTLHLQSPAITGRHRHSIAMGRRIRLLVFPTRAIDALIAEITA